MESFRMMFKDCARFDKKLWACIQRRRKESESILGDVALEVQEDCTSGLPMKKNEKSAGTGTPPDLEHSTQQERDHREMQWSWRFTVSYATRRLHCYSGELHTGLISNTAVDADMPLVAADFCRVKGFQQCNDLPRSLLSRLGFLEAANKFVCAYCNSLTATEKRLLSRKTAPCSTEALRSSVQSLQKPMLESRNRYTPMQKAAKLPAGMDRWADAVVVSRYGHHTYHQAVNMQQQRCCVECYEVLASGHQLPAIVVDEDDSRCHVEYSCYAEMFCNGPCLESFLMKRKTGMARHLLEGCEHGVCRTCNLDTATLQERLLRVPEASRRDFFSNNATDLERNFFERLSQTRQKNVLLHPQRSSHFWEADHIKAVADNGGESSLMNFQTLCLACHSSKSVEERRRRAADRREVKSPQAKTARASRRTRRKQEPGNPAKSLGDTGCGTGRTGASASGRGIQEYGNAGNVESQQQASPRKRKRPRWRRGILRRPTSEFNAC